MGERIQLFLTEWARQSSIFAILLHFLTWPPIKLLASSASVSGNQAVNPRSVCLAPSHSHSGILSIPVGWRQPDLPSQLLCPVPLPPEGIRACVHWLQSSQSPARARKEKFPFQRQPGKAFLEDESMWSLWSPWMCSGVHTQTVRLPKVGSILHLIKGESSHLSKVLI